MEKKSTKVIWHYLVSSKKFQINIDSNKIRNNVSLSFRPVINTYSNSLIEKCHYHLPISFTFILFEVESRSRQKTLYKKVYTLPVKMFGPFWSVWSKTDLAEVGVSLPWWCPTLVLPAPGSWDHFLNLIIFS